MAFIIPFIPLIAAGIGAAVTGVELHKQSELTKQAPVAPTTQQSQSQQGQAQQAAALAQAQALSKRRGMASTLLTSPMGIDSGATQGSGKTLGT